MGIVAVVASTVATAAVVAAFVPLSLEPYTSWSAVKSVLSPKTSSSPPKRLESCFLIASSGMCSSAKNCFARCSANAVFVEGAVGFIDHIEKASESSKSSTIGNSSASSNAAAAAFDFFFFGGVSSDARLCSIACFFFARDASFAFFGVETFFDTF